ncbi:MAG: hypothetical protein CME26_09635 [Gemmatimonadetes bacterium]|nr:hypothetical protein [Gemmatimonadota bacterium]
MQRFQTLIILTTLIALFAWVGYVILGALGAILILALGLTFNLLSARTSARLILHYHRARPIQPHHNRGLYERVRSLAQRA